LRYLALAAAEDIEARKTSRRTRAGPHPRGHRTGVRHRKRQTAERRALALCLLDNRQTPLQS